MTPKAPTSRCPVRPLGNLCRSAAHQHDLAPAALLHVTTTSANAGWGARDARLGHIGHLGMGVKQARIKQRHPMMPHDEQDPSTGSWGCMAWARTAPGDGSQAREEMDGSQAREEKRTLTACRKQSQEERVCWAKQITGNMAHQQRKASWVSSGSHKKGAEPALPLHAIVPNKA
eukprot:1140594-Pelagomonas_calceolata.AAC.1